MNKPSFNLRRLACASLLGLAGAWTSAALAATATSNLGVSATVADNCTISTTTALAFGNYDPVSTNSSADLDNTGVISVTCTMDASTTVTLGQGSNANTGSTGAAPDRRLTDGTNFLSYSLYSDSGRTTVWGDDATVDVVHTGTGTATALTVYGRIGSGQNVPAGSYADTVVATVTF